MSKLKRGVDEVIPIQRHTDMLPDPGIKDTRSEPISTSKLGLIARFDNQKRAAETSTAMGQIRAVYADAVEYQLAASGAQMRGLMMCFGIFLSIFVLAIAPIALVFSLQMIFTQGFGGLMFMDLFILSTVIPLALLAWTSSMLALSAELHAPSDQPVIFDRKRRKIYVASCGEKATAEQLRPEPTSGGFLAKVKWWAGGVFWYPRLFRPKHLFLSATEMDWDCMQAEHQATMTSTGATVLRNHELIFKVYQKPLSVDPQSLIVGEFQVIPSAMLNEGLVPMVYEHIRRYMQEGGDALAPNDALADTWRPRSLWESFGAVGPFGPRFMHWWRGMPVTTVLLLITFPITLPLFIFWGICNRISHATMIPVYWPKEIKDHIGQALQGHPTGGEPVNSDAELLSKI